MGSGEVLLGMGVLASTAAAVTRGFECHMRGPRGRAKSVLCVTNMKSK